LTQGGGDGVWGEKMRKEVPDESKLLYGRQNGKGQLRISGGGRTKRSQNPQNEKKNVLKKKERGKKEDEGERK